MSCCDKRQLNIIHRVSVALAYIWIFFFFPIYFTTLETVLEHYKERALTLKYGQHYTDTTKQQILKKKIKSNTIHVIGFFTIC